MPTEILVALIGLAGSALGSIIGIVASSRLTAYRLEQLVKKVDKHNNLIERMFKVEEKTELLAEKISVANHRIKDLEKGA